MKSKIITREGFQKLNKELIHLWREVRPEVTKMVAWAASLGDRSDNADYQTNKQALRKLDRRIRFLEVTLADIQVVDYNSQQDGKVFFGAWVKLEDENGKTLKLRIVGPEEIYNTTDYISIDSPMARACIGKSADDAIVVNAPNEKHYWTIIAISY
ncbi:MAG: transcription elongation factor GreB [Methylophilaceae bacterium]|jgi:transcription elongation factor GreB